MLSPHRSPASARASTSLAWRALTQLSVCVALYVVAAPAGSSAHAQVAGTPRLEPDVLTAPRATPPPHVVARELRLSAELRALRAQAKYSGWLGGATIALGSAAIAIGAAWPHDAGALLFPLGALALSRGVLGLTLTAGRARQVATYLSQPTYTPDQVRARIAFGEAVFAHQARRARIGRIVDGSISLVVTASYVPLVWWLQRRDNPDYRFADDGFGYAVLALSVVNVAATLFSLLSESAVEQRYHAYQALVERQEREHPGALQHWQAALSLRPLATRSALGLQGALAF